MSIRLLSGFIVLAHPSLDELKLGVIFPKSFLLSEIFSDEGASSYGGQVFSSRRPASCVPLDRIGKAHEDTGAVPPVETVPENVTVRGAAPDSHPCLEASSSQDAPHPRHRQTPRLCHPDQRLYCPFFFS